MSGPDLSRKTGGGPVNVKEFERPPCDKRFFCTTVESWNFRDTITEDHGKYCVRYTITFKDGHTETRQKGGFKTKKEALSAKDFLIIELANHNYIPYSFRMSEFYDYWLYYYMVDDRKIAYNTFVSYRNLVEQMFIYMEQNPYINNVTSEDLIQVLKEYPTKHLRKQAYSMLSSSFQYAKANHIIQTNHAKTAIQIVKYQLRESCKAPKRTAFTLDELITILLTCQKTKPDLYLLLLMSVTTGTRISETLGLCYSDIDFVQKNVVITHQLGRKIDTSNPDTRLERVKVKTSNGIRTIPLPEFVLDEVVLKKVKHDYDKEHDPLFLKDSDYIFTREHGYPMPRNQNIALKRILKAAGFDSTKYTWHDLRHSYATVLKDSDINLKAISRALGHGSKEFTDDVYIDHHEHSTVYDPSVIMNQFFERIIGPKESETYDLSGVNLSNILDE